MDTNHSDPDSPLDSGADLDALLAPLSLLGLGSEPTTIAVPVHTVPIETGPGAPQPLRASSAARMPMNWALTPATDSSQPAYMRGLTDAERPLPSRRSLREATREPHGRRAAPRPRRHRMLWVGVGTGLAASVLIAGALASAGAPPEPVPASLADPAAAERTAPFADDALSRDQPPFAAGPTPLLLEEIETEVDQQPDTEVQPKSPPAPARPPAGAAQPAPSPSPVPSPSPSPSPSPLPSPSPAPMPEPTEPPADEPPTDPAP